MTTKERLELTGLILRQRAEIFHFRELFKNGSKDDYQRMLDAERIVELLIEYRAKLT